MNWWVMGMRNKSKAQIFLEKIESYNILIRNKLIEQQQLKDLALSITANIGSEKVQSTGRQSRMAEAIDRCVDIEAEITAIIEKYLDEKKNIVSTIEKLDSPTEYNLLHMRYVQGISLSDIADELQKEYTWVTTTHGRALKNLQNILNK
jgi:DNA-directed RNA polymerase specialized sigma24 family protein